MGQPLGDATLYYRQSYWYFYPWSALARAFGAPEERDYSVQYQSVRDPETTSMSRRLPTQRDVAQRFESPPGAVSPVALHLGDFYHAGLMRDLVFDIDYPTPDAFTARALPFLADAVPQLEQLCAEHLGIPSLLAVYSGNRGFHLYPQCAQLRRLDVDERKRLHGWLKDAWPTHGALVDEGVVTAYQHMLRAPLSLHKASRFVALPFCPDTVTRLDDFQLSYMRDCVDMQMQPAYIKALELLNSF